MRRGPRWAMEPGMPGDDMGDRDGVPGRPRGEWEPEPGRQAGVPERRPPWEMSPNVPSLRADGVWEGFPKFLVRTSGSPSYWVGVRIPMLALEPGWRSGSPPMGPGFGPGGGPPRLTLVMATDSLTRGGLFLDVRPLAWGVVAAVMVSALLWIPFVRGVTRAIGRMDAATRAIAEGRFEGVPQVRRTDELGSLATSIGRMGDRLHHLIQGQRRFLGDIAHELCSPLARLELAVALLEQRLRGDHEAALTDIRAEIREMSGLVHELLDFSRATLQKGETRWVPVDVATLAREAWQRETGDAWPVPWEGDEPVWVTGDPAWLRRALSNVIRNAIRHGGRVEEIRMRTSLAADGMVEWTLMDRGPGVPETELGRIFEPFYRVDVARGRDSGGVGLGLAIVRTCLEACGGDVRASNRSGGGLAVTFRLRPTRPSDDSTSENLRQGCDESGQTA
jgi:two-component system sensor histidine kinase CpxA